MWSIHSSQAAVFEEKQYMPFSLHFMIETQIKKKHIWTLNKGAFPVGNDKIISRLMKQLKIFFVDIQGQGRK